MKIRIMFKTPDAADYAVERLDEDTAAEVKEKLKRWIKYDELVQLEYDIEADTIKVLES